MKPSVKHVAEGERKRPGVRSDTRKGRLAFFDSPDDKEYKSYQEPPA